MKNSQPLSIRFDKEQLDKANDLGIDIPKYLRQQLSEALGQKKCPMCSQKLVAKKRNVPKKAKRIEKDEDLL